jgi:hypothetical protein
MDPHRAIVVLTIFGMLAGVSLWAYWRERQRNRALEARHCERHTVTDRALGTPTYRHGDPRDETIQRLTNEVDRLGTRNVQLAMELEERRNREARTR